MRFQAISDHGALLFEQISYSIGGGFIVTADDDGDDRSKGPLPYPFQNSADLLQLASSTGNSIAELQFANEQYLIEAAVVREKLDGIRSAMFECIDRGLKLEGELPGGLKVRRRAPILRERLANSENSNMHVPHERLDWVSVFAIAVNEENASGGRVVRSCRECCGNSLAACSGHVKVRPLRRRGQGAWVRGAERGFPSHRPYASGSGRRRATPRAAWARSRHRAARSGF